MSSPSVLILLQPDGTLALALPSDPGRKVPLRPNDILRTINRVLHQQALGESKLDRTGAPSISQARCWSEHSGAYADANCPHCRAGGRFDYKGRGAERRGTTRVVPPGLTGAQVAAAERRASASLSTPRKIEDLGL